jgi:hypothetical protein
MPENQTTPTPLTREETPSLNESLTLPDMQYTLNQEELESLLKNAETNLVVISIGAQRHGPGQPSEVYLYAQSYKTVAGATPEHILNSHLRPLTVCPFPPGWACDEAVIMVTHEQLEYAPKFALNAADIKNVLPNNEFTIGNHKQVLTKLEPILRVNKLDYQFKLFTMNQDGTVVKNTLTAAPF